MPIRKCYLSYYWWVHCTQAGLLEISEEEEGSQDSDRLVSEIPYKWIDYRAEEDAFFRFVGEVVAAMQGEAWWRP